MLLMLLLSLTIVELNEQTVAPSIVAAHRIDISHKITMKSCLHVVSSKLSLSF